MVMSNSSRFICFFLYQWYSDLSHMSVSLVNSWAVYVYAFSFILTAPGAAEGRLCAAPRGWEMHFNWSISMQCRVASSGVLAAWRRSNQNFFDLSVIRSYITMDVFDKKGVRATPRGGARSLNEPLLVQSVLWHWGRYEGRRGYQPKEESDQRSQQMKVTSR